MDQIKGPSMARRATRARWLAWRELRLAGFGFAPIAHAWGCNHTSIIYAERKGWGLPRPPVMIWGPRMAAA